MLNIRVFHIYWLALPLLTTLNQVCIKLLAQGLNRQIFGWEWIFYAMRSPLILAIIACEIATFMVWMKILSLMDLSKASPISAISYALILCVSWVGFHEAILPLHIIGSALILAGVWMIGTAENYERSAL